MSFLYRLFGSSSRADEGLKRKYCRRRDRHDERDWMVSFKPRVGGVFDLVDLRARCPAVYDQGALGSCTANAIGGAYHFDELKQGSQDVFVPSRLFIYYNERQIEGTVDTDSGAEIRDGIKSIASQGVCSEDMWKYDITCFTTKPTQACYDFAQTHKALKYYRLSQTKEQLEFALQNGFPVIFGIEVFESFESEAVAKTGQVPMPASNENLLGGHALLAVGYDRAKQVFIVRNSWGTSWGDQGYCYLPYEYLLSRKLASDFWVVSQVEI